MGVVCSEHDDLVSHMYNPFFAAATLAVEQCASALTTSSSFALNAPGAAGSRAPPALDASAMETASTTRSGKRSKTTASVPLSKHGCSCCRGCGACSLAKQMLIRRDDDCADDGRVIVASVSK